MSGPLALREEAVASLEARPGVYVLGWEASGGSQWLYVGRSDNNLRSRLMQHLPAKETSIRLQISSPDRFWFRYTETPEEAFHIECQLYHAHHYLGNLTHPDRGPDLTWQCLVCERRRLETEGRAGEEDRRAVA